MAVQSFLPFMNLLAGQIDALGKTTSNALNTPLTPNQEADQQRAQQNTPLPVGTPDPSQAMGSTYQLPEARKPINLTSGAYAPTTQQVAGFAQQPLVPDVSVDPTVTAPVAPQPQQAGGVQAPAQQSPAQFDPETGTASWLLAKESGGDWTARNNVKGAGGLVGHAGRIQFGQARFQEAKAAGAIPPDMSFDEFGSGTEKSIAAQKQAERWHWADIDQKAEQKGLLRAYGRTINGVPINRDTIRAMAHLGGIGGAEKFIETNGNYNPADANGTRLSDYGRMATDASKRLTGGSAAGYDPQTGFANPTDAYENPWRKPVAQQEDWEPKNWREKVLGTKPQNDMDISGGAQQYRRFSAALSGLGVGLGQMSHGQTVDISQTFEQFARRQEEMRNRVKEMRDAQIEREENAALYDSLDNDLKQMGQTKKGLDAALQIMTERMKAPEAGMPFDQAVYDRLATRSPGLAEMYANPTTRKEAVTQSAQAYGSEMVDDDGPAGLGMFSPELLDIAKKQDPIAFQLMNSDDPAMRKIGVERLNNASLQQGGANLDWKTTGEQLVTRHPDLAPYVTSEEGVKKALDIAAERDIAEHERISSLPSREAQLQAVMDYDAQSGSTFAQGVDVNNPEAVQAAVNAMYMAKQSDTNIARTSAIETARNQREVDAAAEQRIREKAIDNVEWDELEAKMRKNNFSDEQIRNYRLLPAKEAKERLSNLMDIKASSDVAQDAKYREAAGARAALAETLRRQYKDKPWVDRVVDLALTSDPKAALDEIAFMRQQEEKLAEVEQKEAASAAMADSYANSLQERKIPPEQAQPVLDAARSGDADGARQLYLDLTKDKTTPQMLNYEYMKNLPAAEQPAFAQQLRLASGVVDPKEAKALDVEAQRLTKQADEVNGLSRQIDGFSQIAEMLDDPDLMQTGIITETAMPILRAAEQAGFPLVKGMSQLEAFNAMSNRMVEFFKTEHIMTDTDAARLISIIPSIGKTPEGNKMVTEMLQTLAERRRAEYQAETSYMAEYGTENPLVDDPDGGKIGQKDLFIRSRLREQGMDKNEPALIMMRPDKDPAEVTQKNEARIESLPVGRYYTIIGSNGSPVVFRRGYNDAPGVGDGN